MSAAPKAVKAETKDATTRKGGMFTIQPPNFQMIEVMIEGSAPLMIHKFSAKARTQIETAQTSAQRVTRKRPPKDYAAEFEGARYRAAAGWDGFYAGAIRNSMIGACRFIDGLTMTKAKGLFFIEADGTDVETGTPICKLIGPKPVHDTRPGRNDNGSIDMRNRPRFDQWAAKLRIRFDADAITAQDCLNLLERAGQQVGIGDGRPSSPDSNGLGFGMFHVKPLGDPARPGPRRRGRPPLSVVANEADAS